MRLLMSCPILVILGACASTSVEVTPVPGRTHAPRPVDAPVALCLSPAYGPEFIETLVARFGELELTTRARGVLLGTVEIRPRGGVPELVRAMAEARKLGGDAILIAGPTEEKRHTLVAQVYRSRP